MSTHSLTQEEQDSVEIVKNAWNALMLTTKNNLAIEHISTMVKIPIGDKFALHDAIKKTVEISTIDFRIVPKYTDDYMMVVMNWYKK